MGEDAQELDAWLEKVSPIELRAGARVRVLDWVASRGGLILEWRGRVGLVVGRAGWASRWMVRCGSVLLAFEPERLEVVP
jgi:hypothetical protein